MSSDHVSAFVQRYIQHNKAVEYHFIGEISVGNERYIGRRERSMGNRSNGYTADEEQSQCWPESFHGETTL